MTKNDKGKGKQHAVRFIHHDHGSMDIVDAPNEYGEAFDYLCRVPGFKSATSDQRDQVCWRRAICRVLSHLTADVRGPVVGRNGLTHMF